MCSSDLVPEIPQPLASKHSCGYPLQPGMDWIDALEAPISAEPFHLPTRAILTFQEDVGRFLVLEFEIG